MGRERERERTMRGIKRERPTHVERKSEHNGACVVVKERERQRKKERNKQRK